MANTPKDIPLFAIFITFLLLLNMASAICGRKSETFQGKCVTSIRCNHRCRKVENAAHGLCQRTGLTKECQCYFDECPTEASALGEGGYGSETTPTLQEAKTTVYQQNHNHETTTDTPVLEEIQV
uniref:Defensin-like protein 2 n=1 Tax=Datisca glomerata TaxID=34297 RepID=T1SBT6_DATGL|nr:defensin-like protein 2 [Datisca glomerata]